MDSNNIWLFALTLSAALGCGIVGGVLFAFSTFVMKALGRLAAADGIAAMQSINITVMNPITMAAFGGTALASLALIINALLNWQGMASAYLLIGSVLYIVGTFLVTGAFNVPKNEALAKIAPTDPTSAGFWTNYLAKWTAWNHLRTLAALVAMVFFILALYN